MEWVETTGRSVQEAKDAALDELGVDEADAEFEILAEAQTGLFGRMRAPARVRARVRPTAPRPKDDRRDRRGRRRASEQQAAASNGAETGAAPVAAGRGQARRATEAADAGDDPGGGRRPDRPAPAPPPAPRAAPEKGPGVDVDLDRQAELAADFVRGLVEAFGLQAEVQVVRIDEDTAEVRLSGHDLGILIGPKGSTLTAIQSLARTVVFNATEATNGHINIDVGGYRQKRSEALVRFATEVAERVRTTGARTPLEPMSALDRKIVHDTIAAIDGVSTISEGEDPHRRVVVMPG